MSDGYMKEQGEALAQHLRLTDGKSGYVEATADNFVVYVRKKWPGKQLAEWDGLPPVLLENGQQGWMEAKVMRTHQPISYLTNLGYCHATLRSNGSANPTWTAQLATLP